MSPKRKIVDGIPGIRLTTVLKDKMQTAIKRYVCEKYPFPDSLPVKAWLEKVGNEAYPAEHRDLLGICHYDLCIEHDVDLVLLASKGQVRVDYGEWGYPELSFTIHVFDVHHSHRSRETYLIKFINDRIQKDDTKLVENYVHACIDRRKIVADVQSSWTHELWWSESTRELSEDLQTVVRSIIVAGYVEECGAIKRFKKIMGLS